MIYFADEFGRYSHTREDLDINTYVQLGFIPSHITDKPPLPLKQGYDVVLQGSDWVYFKCENDQ